MIQRGRKTWENRVNKAAALIETAMKAARAATKISDDQAAIAAISKARETLDEGLAVLVQAGSQEEDAP